MLEKEFPTEQNLIHCLQRDYGIEVISLRMLPLGADLAASVYKATSREGKSYFIKLKQGYNDTLSTAITHLLFERGLQQVIRPIKTIHDELCIRLDAVTIVVYPFIEGQDGFRQELTADQWVMLGKALKDIHEIELPASLQKQIRKETYSDRWRKEVRALLSKSVSFQTENESSQKLGKLLNEKKEVILKLVDSAEMLCNRIKKLPAKFVLCHADIHGGNVLIDQNNSLYIVDWDEPMLAPKERDLMFIGGGIANVWNKPHEVELFYSGYGNTEINREHLCYYRCERIVEDIAVFCQELLFAKVSRKENEVMYEQFVDMFTSDGVVDIAFKTCFTLG